MRNYTYDVSNMDYKSAQVSKIGKELTKNAKPLILLGFRTFQHIHPAGIEPTSLPPEGNALSIRPRVQIATRLLYMMFREKSTTNLDFF